MNGAYLFESAKCMALTLQLMQSGPVTGYMEDQVHMVNEFGSGSVSGYAASLPGEVDDFEEGIVTRLGQPMYAAHVTGEISRESLLEFYGRLSMLRQDAVINGLLTSGEFRLAAPEHAHVFAYERRQCGRRFLIVSNWSKASAEFRLDRDFVEGDIRVSVYPDIRLSDKMLLRPYEAFAVFV